MEAFAWNVKLAFFQIVVSAKVTLIAFKGINIMTEKRYTAFILTASDKGSTGEREDKSGPLLAQILKEAGYQILGLKIIADDQELISSNLIEIADVLKANLILTTGGTGFSPRDITPEATMAISERVVPGISEAMRAESLKKTQNAILSRGVSVLRGTSLIINLPGSPKGAKENLEAVLPALAHGLEVLCGTAHDCATPL
jgi:molybdenum cofactor synthesis domain-containing protein